MYVSGAALCLCLRSQCDCHRVCPSKLLHSRQFLAESVSSALIFCVPRFKEEWIYLHSSVCYKTQPSVPCKRDGEGGQQAPLRKQVNHEDCVRWARRGWEEWTGVPSRKPERWAGWTEDGRGQVLLRKTTMVAMWQESLYSNHQFLIDTISI